MYRLLCCNPEQRSRGDLAAIAQAHAVQVVREFGCRSSHIRSTQLHQARWRVEIGVTPQQTAAARPFGFGQRCLDVLVYKASERRDGGVRDGVGRRVPLYLPTTE